MRNTQRSTGRSVLRRIAPAALAAACFAVVAAAARHGAAAPPALALFSFAVSVRPGKL